MHLRTLGGDVDPLKQCLVFSDAVTARGSFGPFASMASMTVILSASLLSARHWMNSAFLFAHVMKHPATAFQQVSLMFATLSRGYVRVSRWTLQTNPFISLSILGRLLKERGGSEGKPVREVLDAMTRHHESLLWLAAVRTLPPGMVL
jgi:hypothetical protein